MRPGQAIVVFDPSRVTAEDMARAVIAKTPFAAEVLSVEAFQESKKRDDGGGENCLFWGLFCG